MSLCLLDPHDKMQSQKRGWWGQQEDSEGEGACDRAQGHELDPQD